MGALLIEWSRACRLFPLLHTDRKCRYEVVKNMMNSRKVDDFRHPERSSSRAGCWGRQMVQDMVAEVRRENDVDSPVEAEAPPKTTRRFTSGWRLSNLYCW